jgi:UDP-N-acetylmuramyl pentapeptide synthase
LTWALHQFTAFIGSRPAAATITEIAVNHMSYRAKHVRNIDRGKADILRFEI